MYNKVQKQSEVKYIIKTEKTFIRFVGFGLIFSGLLILNAFVHAQEFIFPLNRDMETRIEQFISSDTTGFHSAFKPHTVSDLKKIMPYDSILQPITGDGRFYSTWAGRKLRKEHFIFVDEDDLLLSVDPLFNFQIGRDGEAKRNVFVNTRGATISGNVRDKFFFYTRFYENQARYVNYVDSFIGEYQVVPGQGKIKFLEDEKYDFSQAVGGIAYVLNTHFDFVLANDKNFIGDGYRSLLLSDNSYSYPFLKINMTFWKFRYTVLYQVLQDLRTPHDFDVGFYKKYATTHYLDLNIGKKNKIKIGVFETVLWKPAASRGYELSYLNPMLFLRPVENSLDSPDNVLLGLNARWNINSRNVIYGQLMLDEFIISEVRSGRGWWGNKQGLQGGFKSFSLFGIKSLNFQSEVNFVRPYTYQHRSEEQNYTHYNQALAHPLGANFLESVTIINYRWRNIFGEVKYQYAKNAQDTGGVNYGNDIFKNYLNHGPEYGHFMFDGLAGKLSNLEFRLNYLVNPRMNFNIEAGIVLRKFSNAIEDSNTQLIYFGLRTSLENYYFDF